MQTIEQWKQESQESFALKRKVLVGVAQKLQDLGFRIDDSEAVGFTYQELNDGIYLIFTDMKALKEALSKLVEVFGTYKVDNIWHGHGDMMIASYRFENGSHMMNVWFQAPVAEFPLDKFSPGCKIVERSESSFAVECLVAGDSE